MRAAASPPPRPSSPFCLSLVLAPSAGILVRSNLEILQIKSASRKHARWKTRCQHVNNLPHISKNQVFTLARDGISGDSKKYYFTLYLGSYNTCHTRVGGGEERDHYKYFKILKTKHCDILFQTAERCRFIWSRNAKEGLPIMEKLSNRGKCCKSGDSLATVSAFGNKLSRKCGTSTNILLGTT